MSFNFALLHVCYQHVSLLLSTEWRNKLNDACENSLNNVMDFSTERTTKILASTSQLNEACMLNRQVFLNVSKK